MNKKEALKIVKKYKFGWELEKLPDKFKKDKEVVLAAVKQHFGTFEYADKSLKKDKDVVVAALKQHAINLYYADKSFRKDKKIISLLIKKNQARFALDLADESLKKDKKIVLAAVQKDGTSLEYADESLKKDKKIVLAAVKQEDYALEYADESLKKDKDILAIINKKKSLTVIKKKLPKDYIDEKLKDKFGVYEVLLVHNSKQIMYRENVILVKKMKIKPFEYWISIEKKDLKNLTYKRIYNFVKGMVKDKTIINRVQNLKTFLKTNNTLYLSGVWNDYNDDEVLKMMFKEDKIKLK